MYSGLHTRTRQNKTVHNTKSIASADLLLKSLDLIPWLFPEVSITTPLLPSYPKCAGAQRCKSSDDLGHVAVEIRLLDWLPFPD